MDRNKDIFTDWLLRQFCRSYAEVIFKKKKFSWFAKKKLFSGVEIFFSRFVAKNKWDTLAFFLRTGC